MGPCCVTCDGAPCDGRDGGETHESGDGLTPDQGGRKSKTWCGNGRRSGEILASDESECGDGNHGVQSDDGGGDVDLGCGGPYGDGGDGDEKERGNAVCGGDGDEMAWEKRGGRGGGYVVLMSENGGVSTCE